MTHPSDPSPAHTPGGNGAGAPGGDGPGVGRPGVGGAGAPIGPGDGEGGTGGHGGHGGIVRLDPVTVNRIAAGEVVERPASVAKELIENALDAGARRIEIATAGGGRALLRVSDDGVGIAAADIALALERHATSKLDHDLMDVRTLGFRGEALPSIGSVARLTVTSKARAGTAGRDDADAARRDDGDGRGGHAMRVRMEGGRIEAPHPAPGNPGTVVEVRDLFYATPARLKFLRSERAEASAILDVVRRAALAHPAVRFALSGPDRRTQEWPAREDADPAAALLARIGQVLGEEAAADMMPVEGMREGVLMTGFAGLPAFNRNNALHQFVFVNGRPVRDKQILGALRGAYGDLVPKGRHPVAVLFIDCPPGVVDVNVHPQKAEVRFRDPGLVRGLIVGTLREALERAGPGRGSRGLAGEMAAAFGSRVDPERPGPGAMATRAAAFGSGASGSGSMAATLRRSVGWPGSEDDAAHGEHDPRGKRASQEGGTDGQRVGTDGHRVGLAEPVTPFAGASTAAVPTPGGSMPGSSMPSGSMPGGSSPNGSSPDGPRSGSSPGSSILADPADARGHRGPGGIGAPSARIEPPDADALDHPLGAARAQLHECYILSQTRDGIVLIDQHAAHERLVMEEMKATLLGTHATLADTHAALAGTRAPPHRDEAGTGRAGDAGQDGASTTADDATGSGATGSDANGAGHAPRRALPSQMLLLPEIVTLGEDDAERLAALAPELTPLGLEIERFGADAVAVRATPALLGRVDAAALVRDLSDEIAEWGTADTLRHRIDAVVATMACHGSVRGGRRMGVAEMDALLRRIEAVPAAAQCNHGRPTFIHLALRDLERLFGR